jgi:hypothetical protein
MGLTRSPARLRRRIAVLTLVASQLACASAFAQSDADRIKDLERKLERSMQLIEQLTKRVNDLEKAPAAPAPASPARAQQQQQQQQQEARIEAIEKNVGAIAATRGASAERGTPLQGFADVTYEHSNEPRSDTRKSGFAIGNLDLYITPSFGDRVKTLAELVFEIAEDGTLATDLERLQLGYTVSDNLTLWVGRFHTPYGYWNAAFHHGAQIQTSVTRPRFIDFEDKGGILPAHTVGLWGTGHTGLGSGKLVYDAYIGNGNRIADGVLDFNARRDDNSNKAFGLNLGYRFAGTLDGVTLGMHTLNEDVASYDGAGEVMARARVAMLGGYAVLDKDQWEGIAEYYRFRNKDLSGSSGTHASWAAFLQLGYTLRDLWTPYYRWEKADLDQADSYFASQESGRSYSRHVLGLRYILNEKAALKIEANRTRDAATDKSFSEVRAQFAIRF